MNAVPGGLKQSDLSPPNEGLFFDQGQRRLVIRALSEAEDRISGYYCITPRHWQELRYDLITGSDSGWMPLPDAALAKVQRVRQMGFRTPGALEFFRIQLNDPGILSAVRREKLEPIFYPFLVYILTHEMVHLVRLSSILDEREQLPHSADLEEQRVERISRQILKQAGADHFRPVLDILAAR